MVNEGEIIRNKGKELSDVLEIHDNEVKPSGRIQYSYFEPKSFEKGGKIYELLGIRKFKNILLSYAEKHGRPRGEELTGSNYYIGSDLSEKSLDKFKSRTKYNEKLHLFTGLPFLAGSIFSFAIGQNVMGVSFSLLALSDFYLISLQRYNRARIHEILSRKNAKKIKKQVID